MSQKDCGVIRFAKEFQSAEGKEENMRTDILDYLQKEVYARCRRPANKIGMGCYYHIEELCVADADAISHFDNVPSLLYLAYAERKMKLEEGIQFVKGKLNRSYSKMSSGSREFYKDKYLQVMKVLSSQMSMDG